MDPHQRFNEPLKTLRAAFSTEPHSALLERIFEKPKDLKDDVRTRLFHMEALLRLYRERKHQGEAAAEILLRIKELEDAIGDYGEAYENVQFAEMARAPENVLENLRRTLSDGEAPFLKFLTQKEWLHPHKKGAIDKLEKEIRDYPLKSEKEDLDFLLKTMAEYQSRLHDKIESRAHDLTKPEKGVHELRRNLRWFLIDIAALRGRIDLYPGACPNAELAEDTKDKRLTESEFAKIEGPEKGRSSCRISSCLFFALSRAVRDLGWIKDILLAQEFLNKALLATGTKKSASEKLAMEIAIRHPNYGSLRALYPNADSLHDMAEKVRDRLRRTALQKLLADELSACR